MALDVTPGGSASDSYLSLADALAYANNDLGRYATAWLEADEATREKALRRATRDIDRYAGATTERYSVDQALAFPRWSDLDADGNPILPMRLEEATYQQAIYVLANANVIDDAGTRRARQMETFAEPNVSGSITKDWREGLLAPAATALLTGEGFEGGAVVGWIATT